jgi:hypothetical protein
VCFTVSIMLDAQGALNQGKCLWENLLLPCPYNFTPRSRLFEPLRKSCPYCLQNLLLFGRSREPKHKKSVYLLSYAHSYQSYWRAT